MSYHGDIRLGDTIDIKFSSRSFSTGAPTTLAGTPAVAAYVGNSTTEITAGITLTVDFDARTGLHNVRVVATSGNGYATASNYQLVLTAGTVGGVSVVGEVIGEFSVENRSALMPATAGRTAVVDAAGLIDANAVKVGPSGSGTAQTAGDIPARLPAALTGGGNMKSDMLAVNGSTSAASMVALLNGSTVVYSGTVTGAATTTTLIDSGLTQADTDWWKGRIIIFTSVLTLQATDITAFDPATDKLTFTATTQAPTGATYVII